MKHVDWSEKQISEYVAEGDRKARALDNRGPIRFDADGSLHPDILDAYWKDGFYVFQDVLGGEELADLRSDLDDTFTRAPIGKDAEVDAQGKPPIGSDLDRKTFRFGKPLSDPNGETGNVYGRYEVRMSEPDTPDDAPEQVITNISSHLHIMDSCLRLYGHPKLLRIAEAINGPDFTPFTESIIVKPARLGASVAWHQDGTTQWNHPDWDQGTHGFNFMAQIYGSTALNGVWLIPGSHKEGKISIRAVKEANGGSDRFPNAVPMVAEPGDVCMANRQALHGSFPNTSHDTRITVNFGFHRRSSVLGVTKGDTVYDEGRIRERSRIIALAIDARHQRFPVEDRYAYPPLAGCEDENRWSEETRESLLKNYNLLDLGL
jgi:hypothetical protein